jgi:hypothetical protein
MISYGQVKEADFNFTFRIKKKSIRQLVKKFGVEIMKYNSTIIRKFDPTKIKIVISENFEVGYISTLIKENKMFIESIIIDLLFEGKK